MMNFTLNNSLFNAEYSSITVSESIKKAFEKIKEVVYGAVNKIVSNESSIDKLILEIKNNCNDMEDILENFIQIFEDEYYYFTSIKSMLFYILDNINETIEYLQYVKELFLSFYNLIQSKSHDYFEEYELKQNEFDLELDTFEQKFYTEICKPSKHFDEVVLSGITNSLLDL